MKITLIQGHPDPDPARFCRVLAGRYLAGAQTSGHASRSIDVTELDFPLIRTREEYDQGAVPPPIAEAQHSVRWADHVVMVYPLWQGTMPALFKGFLEQLLRPAFTGFDSQTRRAKRGGRQTARLIVTMGMPVFLYRWYFGAPGVRGLERTVLRYSGFGSTAHTMIGGVHRSDAARKRWLEHVGRLGERGL